jgi:hypothetical protein
VSGGRPNNIPARPDHVYWDEGWQVGASNPACKARFWQEVVKKVVRDTVRETCTVCSLTQHYRVVHEAVI